MSRVRHLLTAAILLLAVITVPMRAQAPASRSLGPTDPVTGFPIGIIDDNGVSLRPCLTNLVMCLAGSTLPDVTRPAAVPGNFPEEFFYSVADSAITSISGGGKVVFRFAIEGSFATAPTIVAGQQTLFGRVRLRILGGLTDGAWYRITHPYGVFEAQAVAKPGTTRADLNFTEDLGCVAGVVGIGLGVCPPFNLVLTATPIPFLIWDPAVLPAAPAGFIGIPGIPHRVTGSPTGNNFVRIEQINGPGGSVRAVLASSDQFQVAGQLIDFTPPTATITSPPGGVVSGSIAVNATGADAAAGSGLASLSIRLDNTTTLTTSATSPASLIWNTTTVANGPHTLTAVATDVAGNVGTSAPVGVTVFNDANVAPPVVGAPATLTVTATGRANERVLSSPAGINVAVGSTGTAVFPVPTTVVLSATNGRAVIWAGACSSGGLKTQTCTFTVNGDAGVAANVR